MMGFRGAWLPVAAVLLVVAIAALVAAARREPLPAIPQPSNAETGITQKLAELIAPADVWNGPGPDAVVQAHLQETTVAITFAAAPTSSSAIRIQYLDVASGEWIFGWIRATDARSLVAERATFCPRRDGPHILSAFPQEALTCLAGDEVNLGTIFIRRRQVLALYDGTPAWLATVGDHLALVSPDGDAGAMAVHFAPPPAPPGSAGDGWFIVSGHFHDERSATCSRTPRHDPLRAESVAEQTLWCRQQFVISRLEPAAAP
jgi:hypothetical protein